LKKVVLVLEGVSDGNIYGDKMRNIFSKFLDLVSSILELLGKIIVELVNIVVFQSCDALKSDSQVVHKVLEACDCGSRAASRAILKIGAIREIRTTLWG